MAIRGPIPISFEQVFPFGAIATTTVEPVPVFEGKPGEQEKDEATGLRVWQLTVMDNDPEVKGPAKSVKVKVLAEVRPVLPTAIAGLPEGVVLTPVEFEQMAATPYLTEPMKGRFKITYSLRARAITAPKTLAEVKSSAGRVPAAAGAK